MKYRWDVKKGMPVSIYHKQSTGISYTLYYLGTAVSYLMSFMCLPLRVIPEDWCYNDDGYLKRTNWVTSLFWWEWLHNIEMWAFELSLRYDPDSRVWSDHDDARYAFYKMIIGIDVMEED